MTTKPNQLKRLYWHMVLATSVLLAFSSTCPKAMDSKTIVAASSASQHALSVSQSDARAKRYLGSKYNTSVTRNNDDIDEERVTPIMIDFFGGAAEKEIAETAAHLTAPVNPIATEGPENVETHLAKIIGHFEAYQTLLSRRAKYGAGKNVPNSEFADEKLKFANAMKMMANRWHDNALVALSSERLEGFMDSPFLILFIKNLWDMEGEKPIEFLVTFLKEHFNHQSLSPLYKKAENDGTMTLQALLEKLLFDSWQTLRLRGEDVFETFDLGKADNQLFESSLWNLFVAYLTKLMPTKTPKEIERVASSMLQKRIGDERMEELIAASRTKSAKKRMERENDDIAALPIKRKPWHDLYMSANLPKSANSVGTKKILWARRYNRARAGGLAGRP